MLAYLNNTKKYGGVAEWSKALDSKSSVGATPPWVQIPPPPPAVLKNEHVKSPYFTTQFKNKINKNH